MPNSQGPTVRRLREALDAALVGQKEAKEGLLLALLARQHAYLEGPPGCGKSALAEALASASGAQVAAVRFHRDLRETDLLGDALIRRDPIPDGERISRDIHPGPLLEAEVAVLDDITRAPGEALGVLVRVLSDRMALGRKLPLETAIATAPPADAPEGYTDPLEPTQLDRFAVQVRLEGLLQSKNWAASQRLMRAPEATPSASAGGITARERRELQACAGALEIPGAVREAWLGAVARVAALSRDAGGAILSDRTFCCAAMDLLRAHALLRGAERVEPRDLRVMRFLVMRRVPARVLAWVEAVVEEAVAEAEGREDEDETGDGAPDEELEVQDSGSSPDGEQRVRERREDPADEDDPGREETADDSAEVDELLRALRGRLDRGRVEREEDPGGSPRSLHALRRFDEILDADPVEVQLLVEGRLRGMPRTLRREKPIRGGALVLLRDISASMSGPYARWAGAVVAGLIHAGARRRMKVGYVEFNHESNPLRMGDTMLHRNYREVLAAAGVALAKGRTNYEAPLRQALDALQEHRGVNRHIIMLTDGVPVLGDPVVSAERALAARLGVRIHTVFLGKGDCPKVLDAISLETEGMRFFARLDGTGRIHVAERGAHPRAA